MVVGFELALSQLGTSQIARISTCYQVGMQWYGFLGIGIDLVFKVAVEEQKTEEWAPPEEQVGLSSRAEAKRHTDCVGLSADSVSGLPNATIPMMG